MDGVRVFCVLMRCQISTLPALGSSVTVLSHGALMRPMIGLPNGSAESSSLRTRSLVLTEVWRSSGTTGTSSRGTELPSRPRRRLVTLSSNPRALHHGPRCGPGKWLAAVRRRGRQVAGCDYFVRISLSAPVMCSRYSVPWCTMTTSRRPWKSSVLAMRAAGDPLPGARSSSVFSVTAALRAYRRYCARLRRERRPDDGRRRSLCRLRRPVRRLLPSWHRRRRWPRCDAR